MRETQASSTAQVIARSIVYLSHDRKLRHLLPSGAAEASRWFVEAFSKTSGLFVKCSQWSWFRAICRLLERCTIPGIILHYVLRKRYIEDVARTAIQEGFQQVIVLGGGFDTLALRLHQEFTNVTFIELDHPSTQKVKAGALKKHRLPNETMALVPIDFSRQDFSDVLAHLPCYRNDVKSLLICEGVLMYLSCVEVDSFFKQVASCSACQTRIAFTFMEPQADGRVRFATKSRLIDWWISLRKEPFDWGIKREEIPAYLASRKLNCRAMATAEDLARQYLDDQLARDTPLAHGEFVCVAEHAASGGEEAPTLVS